MEANFREASELANLYLTREILNMTTNCVRNRSTKTELVLMAARSFWKNTVRRTVQSWFWKQQIYEKIDSLKLIAGVDIGNFNN